MEIIKYDRIPKIVHQIWLGPFNPPMKWMDSWKEGFCKKFGWQYKLWREVDLTKFGLTNKASFDVSESFQQKSDIARYEVVFREGGFYIDCDMVWLGRDLSQYMPINTQSFIGVQEPPSTAIKTIGPPYLSNGIFLASKGHKILQRCVLKIPERVKMPIKHTFMKTGPALLNTCVDEIITIVPHQLVFPLDFHKKTNISDPMKFSDRALIFTYNGLEYPHIKKAQEELKQKMNTQPPSKK